MSVVGTVDHKLELYKIFKSLIHIMKFPMTNRFIEKYGTHILVGLSIGGKDSVLVKQDVSSNLEPTELKKHLDELGDELFNGTCNFPPKAREQKQKVK